VGAFEQAGGTLAAADAHGDDGVAALAAFELVQRRGGELGAGAAERVAQRDGAAVDVELVGGDLEGVLDVDGLAGERFVELDQIDVAHRQARLCKQLANGGDGSDPHDGGIDPSRCEGAEIAQGLDAQLVGFCLAHHQRRGSAVTQRRRAAGGDGAFQRKGGSQLGEPLEGGTRAGQLVGVEAEGRALSVFVTDGIDRDDLIAKLVGFESGLGLHLRVIGEGVLILAADLELVGDVLGGDPHRGVRRRHALHQLRRSAQVKARHRHFAHGFDAASQHDVVLTKGDRAGGDGDGLQAARAEPVDGHGAGLLG